MYRILLFCLLFISSIYGQTYPSSFLSPEFHQNKRDLFRASMPQNSIVVLFSYPIRKRSNTINHHYHQNPNFYYLTGSEEPHSALLLFSSPIEIDGVMTNEVLFTQTRSAYGEQWDGLRMGVEGVKNDLGIEVAFEGKDFEKKLPNLEQFDKILMEPIPVDVMDDSKNTADLYSLIKTIENRIHKVSSTDKELDQYTFVDFEFVQAYLGKMREVKSDEEMILLKKAIAISVIGQIEVMKAMHPGMSEREIQGIHEFVFKKYGAEFEGYPSIIGGGSNGCVLHYVSNHDIPGKGDLVLMDVGAEYFNYTADITRTIPVNGRFSEEQKIIYELVLKAQNAAISKVEVGASFWLPHQTAQSVIAEGLMELGIITNPSEASYYFPHGSSHYIGLDVHDIGSYGPFKENSFITVEPGIYIPENSPCDQKWWGIAIRIEDDIWITADGPVNLSEDAPRKVEEIELLMEEGSTLDSFILPELDSLIK